MRGLDIRTSFAIARIQDRFFPDPGCSKVAYVLDMAECEGLSEFLLGIYDPPIMFQDEPELLKAWRCGQEFGRAVHEM